MYGYGCHAPPTRQRRPTPSSTRWGGASDGSRHSVSSAFFGACALLRFVFRGAEQWGFAVKLREEADGVKKANEHI